MNKRNQTYTLYDCYEQYSICLKYEKKSELNNTHKNHFGC